MSNPNDSAVAAIPPDAEALPADTPVMAARAVARNALAGAMEVLRAAHRSAATAIDAAAADMAGPGSGWPPGTAGESRAMAESMRDDALVRMETRSLMLAEALQRTALLDIGRAHDAVGAILHAQRRIIDHKE